MNNPQSQFYFNLLGHKLHQTPHAFCSVILPAIHVCSMFPCVSVSVHVSLLSQRPLSMYVWMCDCLRLCECVCTCAWLCAYVCVYSISVCERSVLSSSSQWALCCSAIVWKTIINWRRSVAVDLFAGDRQPAALRSLIAQPSLCLVPDHDNYTPGRPAHRATVETATSTPGRHTHLHNDALTNIHWHTHTYANTHTWKNYASTQRHAQTRTQTHAHTPHAHTHHTKYPLLPTLYSCSFHLPITWNLCDIRIMLTFLMLHLSRRS
jgi:hypothetical protein